MGSSTASLIVLLVVCVPDVLTISILDGDDELRNENSESLVGDIYSVEVSARNHQARIKAAQEERPNDETTIRGNEISSYLWPRPSANRTLLESGPGSSLDHATHAHPSMDPDLAVVTRDFHKLSTNYVPFNGLQSGGDVLGGTNPVWLQNILDHVPVEKQLAALHVVRGMATTLVMGSGTSVLANKWGQEIDRFPEIIRFNRFEIKGYEEFVGTRTTQWTTNNIDIRKGKPPPAMKLLNGIKTVLTIVPSPRSSGKVKKDVKKRNKQLAKKLKIVLFGGTETKNWKRKLNLQANYISTGLVSMLLLVGRAPLVYHGFDFGKGSHGHYWQIKKDDTCHNLSGEGFVMQEMERDGVLVQLACLESKTREEMLNNCKVSTLIASIHQFSTGCKKNNKGVRTDKAAQQGVDRKTAVYGNAQLPEPLLRGL